MKDQIKRMPITLRNHTFDGEDPIQVLAFLRHFVDEANTLDMNHAQAYIAIPYFLKGFALDQYQAAEDAYSANEGGVSCWPEAVQYLPRSYVTSNAIREATLSLRDVRQNSRETDMKYSNRLNQAELRCGNVHSLEEKMTMFVNGLDPAIEPLVARHRESHPKITYLELVYFARDEGNANRARRAQGRRPNIVVIPKKSVPRKERASAMMTDSDDDFLETRSISRAFDNNVDPLQYIGDGEYSFPTTDLPTTYDTAFEDPSREEDAMFVMEQRRHVPSPRVAFSERDATMSRRPGWIQDRRYAKPQHGGRSRADGIICHGCYEKEHIQSDCPLTLKELWKVVKNYEALTDAEKARVPPISYFCAKAQFTTDGRIVTPGVPTSQEPTPYPRTSEPHPRVLSRRDTTDHSSKN